MYNHAPKDYVCPFCLIVEGIDNEHLYTKQNDNLYKTDRKNSPPEERVEYAKKLRDNGGCNMLNEKYSLCYAEMKDIDSWIKMVDIIKDNFPGLETVEKMDDYRQTVIKNIKRKTAICVNYKGNFVGVMLFSYNSKCLSCMAVHPNHRKKGIASAMIEKMLSLFPDNTDITVTTFRADDIKGFEPRPLYKKYGFEEDELITEFDYPLQKFILHKNK